MNRKKMEPLKYFFYRDQLHRKIHINKGSDLMTAWNFPEAEVRKYVYSDVRKNGQKAFSTAQVGEMVDRTPYNLLKHIKEGNVKTPQHAYYMDSRAILGYYWQESEIMELHEFLKTVHIGRPRQDGEISTRKLPSTAELRAMIRQGTVLYVKNAKGDFVPTWQAENF